MKQAKTYENVTKRFYRPEIRKCFRQCRASDLTEGDRLEENLHEQKGKDDLHETSKDL